MKAESRTGMLAANSASVMRPSRRVADHQPVVGFIAARHRGGSFGAGVAHGLQQQVAEELGGMAGQPREIGTQRRVGAGQFGYALLGSQFAFAAYGVDESFTIVALRR